jgi:tetratricopeptide (TPR) repeat protein
VLGPEHPHTLMTRNNLGEALLKESHYTAAEKLERETLEVERPVFGPEHPETMQGRLSLADRLIQMGKYSDAEKLRSQVLEIRRGTLGPDHPDALEAMEVLGTDLSYEKQYGRAETIYREAIRKASQSPDKSVLAEAWYNFACGAAVAGHPDAAFDHLGKAADLGSEYVAVLAGDLDLDITAPRPSLRHPHYPGQATHCGAKTQLVACRPASRARDALVRAV